MAEPFLRNASEIQTIMALFAEAKRQHGKPAVERLEQGLLIAAGLAQPVTPADPLQRPGLYIPGIPARAWHEAAEIEGVQALERAADTIRIELLAAIEKRRGFQQHRVDKDLGRDGKWNALYLRQDPLSFSDNRALCPETVRLVDAMPRLGEIVMFSALTPGAHIEPHAGPWNARLTVHLGLVVPDGCEFRVGSESRRWREGKCLVFDDSFEHEVWNRSDSTRVVLLLDVWHPDLTEIEIAILSRARSLIIGNQREALQVIEQGRNELRGRHWWV